MSQTNENHEVLNSSFYHMFFSNEIIKIKEQNDSESVIKSVLVLIPGTFGLSSTEETIYKSIVAATKAPADIFRIKLCPNGQDFDFLAEPDYSLILSFGVLSPVKAEVEKIGNSQVIYSYSISDLAIDSGKKKLLWGCLKKVFGL